MKNWLSIQIALFASLLISIQAKAATYYSRQNGNWNQNTTWSTGTCGGSAAAGTPGAADIVYVCNGHTVNVTANANVNSVTVQSGGTLKTGTTGGGANKTLTISGNFVLLNNGTYIHNNNQTAASTIFAGTESFAAGSTFRVDNWSFYTASLVTGCSSNFGNLYLNWNPGFFYWNNNGVAYTRTIAGNLTVTNDCATYFDNTNGDKTFTIGGNVDVNSGYLRFKQSGTGNATINVSGTITISNISYVYGIYAQNGAMTLTASGINQSNGVFYGIYNGDGNASFTVAGTWTHSGGDFRGIQNNTTYTSGVPTFQLGNLNYSGGVYMGNYGCNTGSGSMVFNVTGNVSVSYTASTDIIALNRLATLGTTANTLKLNFSIGGNLTIGGAQTGEFNSNNGSGSESTTIGGNVVISNGNNYFNVVPDYGGNGHANVMNIGGVLSVSGGNTYLSAEAGSLTYNQTGNVTISGGILSAKGKGGTGALNFNTNFSQSGGTFNLYNNAGVVSANAVNLIVLGDFTHTGGTINFSNNAASTAVNTITLKGANYTLGTSGNITRAGAGTSPVFGYLNFDRNGTIVMSRFGTHDIQQVKQQIITGTTLNLTTGNLQIASHATAAVDFFTINNGAILDVNSNQVMSNATAANSGIQALSNGRLRFSRQQGLFDNTANAVLNSAGALNFDLNQNSIVEYYGTIDQVLTGINVGIATSTAHKYGILEINNTGVSASVVPTNLPSANTAVYVRQELRLTNGVLNLAGASGNPASGGRTVFVERADPTAITRSAGIIRSEAQDQSARINWNISNVAGIYTVPFGYSTSEYIPVVYTLTSGSPGAVDFSTYHTPADNLPWPPGVNNLNGFLGLSPDNRDATVDRYWRISPAGVAQADIEFNYLVSELPLSPYNNPSSLRAQHYEFASNAWLSALPMQSAGAAKVTVPNTTIQTDWTISNNVAPLPVEWLLFKATALEQFVQLDWATAVEKNNDYFVIERTTDFSHIEVIGHVKGAGNASTPSYYRYNDIKPLSGISYYRLRQVDIDGTEDLTEWQAVQRVADSNPVLVAWPNPAAEFVNVDGLQSEVLVSLVDATGRIVMKKLLDMQSNRLDIQSLSAGIYSLNYTTISGENKSLMLMKK